MAADLVSGLGGGLEDVGQGLLRRNLSEQASARVSQRELVKDATDKVASGSWEPDQAEQALTMQGIRVPHGYFRTLQPSVESGLQKVIGGVNKADTFQSVEGPAALASEPSVKRLPLRLGKFDSPAQDFTGEPPTPEIPQPEGFDDTESTTPDKTLASTQMQQFSPEFNNLLKIRNEKLDSFAPKEVQGVDANGVKNTQFVPSRPDSLTGRSFQMEPTGAQTGRQLSNKDLSQQIGNNEGGLPKLKGEAFVDQENVERPAKVRTATEMAKGTAQAGIDVSTSPANVQLEARKAATIADATQRARDIAERSGIPPQIVSSYISTTATGRSYAFVPSEVPAMERRVIFDGLATPSAANPNGIKPVTKDQMVALQALDKARADYDDLMSRIEGHLSKSAGGRPLSALTNTIGMYAQTDPELLAAMRTSFPQIIQNLKANAGTVGRIMQIELEGMAKSIPQATDTWQVAQMLQMREFKLFENAENAILGHPKAK